MLYPETVVFLDGHGFQFFQTSLQGLREREILLVPDGNETSLAMATGLQQLADRHDCLFPDTQFSLKIKPLVASGEREM